jgi:hypothetical protein
MTTRGWCGHEKNAGRGGAKHYHSSEPALLLQRHHLFPELDVFRLALALHELEARGGFAADELI